MRTTFSTRSRIELAMLADLARIHRRVGGMAAAAKPLVLDLACDNHPLADFH